jgi:hypothetical protein
VNPARLQPSRVVRPNSHSGRSCSSSFGAGASPTTYRASSSSISVMLSGCAGHPGMHTIGRPERDRQLQPR